MTKIHAVYKQSRTHNEVDISTHLFVILVAAEASALSNVFLGNSTISSLSPDS
jgi:hypothetical protein